MLKVFLSMNYFKIHHELLLVTIQVNSSFFHVPTINPLKFAIKEVP
ncbi:MAG: hypothetical protein ACJAVF_001612 [Paraglaciecola sp.]